MLKRSGLLKSCRHIVLLTRPPRTACDLHDLRVDCVFCFNPCNFALQVEKNLVFFIYFNKDFFCKRQKKSSSA